MPDLKRLTFEEFQLCEIERDRGYAAIVLDYVSPDTQDPDLQPFIGRPVHLLGFSTKAKFSDFQILERGYRYYRKLIRFLKTRKK